MGIMAGVIGVRLNLVEPVLVWEPFRFGEVYFSDGLKEDPLAISLCVYIFLWTERPGWG